MIRLPLVTPQEPDPSQIPNKAADDLLPEMIAALEGLFEHCAMVHNKWGEGSNLREADAAIKAARIALNKAQKGQ